MYLGHIIKLFFGIFNCAEFFLCTFLWYKLKLKMTFCSKMKFCLVNLLVLYFDNPHGHFCVHLSLLTTNRCIWHFQQAFFSDVRMMLCSYPWLICVYFLSYYLSNNCRLSVSMKASWRPWTFCQYCALCLFTFLSH